MNDFWVFGYGSLMWRPGFEFLAQEKARIHGYRRALCVYSWVHRGTEERPGLVLGLDRGGSCCGMAFKVAGKERDTVMAYLRERELVTNVYLEKQVRVQLESGETIEAVTYIVDQHHQQYARPLPVQEAASIIRGAVGQGGPNPDYVTNTVDLLRSINIRDSRLEAVAKAL